MEEVLCKEVSCDSGHEEREYEGNSEWDTVSEFFDIIATSLLTNVSIIVSLIGDCWLWVGVIDSKLMFIF